MPAAIVERYRIGEALYTIRDGKPFTVWWNGCEVARDRKLKKIEDARAAILDHVISDMVRTFDYAAKVVTSNVAILNIILGKDDKINIKKLSEFKE